MPDTALQLTYRETCCRGVARCVLTADFSVVDPYRMMRADRRFRRKVTQPFVHASRTQVNIIATRCEKVAEGAKSPIIMVVSRE
jgi:hypothetical protein